MTDSTQVDVVDETYDLNALKRRTFSLIADFNSIAAKHRNKTCMYLDCNEPAIDSHVLSRSSIRKYAGKEILQLQTINYEPFKSFDPERQRKYYKPCNLNKVSTFGGFCDKHDPNLFRELDNYDGVMTPQVALQIHYRIICYGLNVIQLQFKQLEFLKRAGRIGAETKKAKEILRRLNNGFFERGLKLAERDYLERKSICENMLVNGDYKIEYTLFEGDMSNPLFFGRAGIFLHQFYRDKLPKRFMEQMPYITYSSITDGRSCNLIFTFLEGDAEEYAKHLNAFINSQDFKKRLEILIYSQSDCCILRKNIPEEWNNTVKNIVEFYR